MALDNMKPIDVVALTPKAEAVNTYVTPAKQDDAGANLMSLAKGLSSLNAGLSGWLDENKAKQDKEDALLGEAEFHKRNGQGFTEAVQQGLVPAQYSKAFMDGYKRTQGTVAGFDLGRKFNAAYDAWGDKSSDDPQAYSKFVSGFLKENVATNDPAILSGLLPQIRSMTNEGQSRMIADRHKQVVAQTTAATGAETDNSVDVGRGEALAAGKPIDYEKVFGEIDKVRQDKLTMGLADTQIDPVMIDTVTAKAIEYRDPKMLGWLERQVPGKNYTFADTPYGRAKKAETINTLETMGRRAITEAKAQQTEADKKAYDDVTRRTVDALAENPNAPMDETLIKEGEKYDGEFRTKINTWRGNILGDKGRSDPGQVLQLNWDIISGGGHAAIQRGITNGIFKSADELRAAQTLAKSVEEQAPKVDAIMSRDSAKRVLDTIKQRTLSSNDLGALFAPDGLTDKGMAAQYDFKQSVLAWSASHPKATPAELETATATIGATILKGITGEPGDAVTYTQPQGAPASNPYMPGSAPVALPAPAAPVAPPAAPTGQPATPAEPAAPVAPTGAPVAPVAPNGFGPKVDPAIPAATPEETGAVKAWMDSQPGFEANVTKSASAQGIPPEALALIAWRRTHGGDGRSNLPGDAPLGDGFKALTSPAPAPAAPAPVAPVAPPVAPTLADTVRAAVPGVAAAIQHIVTGKPPAAPQAPAPVAPVAQPTAQTRPDGSVASKENPIRENEAVSQDVSRLVAAAFEREITASAASKGNYTLATIKDDPHAARILDFVAGPESKGNYNAYFGNVGSKKNLSAMTVGQVLAWQKQRTDGGSPSSATGRYQFMRTTLTGLVKKMGIGADTKFTPLLQDQLAIQLLKDRGLDQFKAGKMSAKDFSLSLAKEWASLPDPRTGRSYYAGDGLNASLVTSSQVLGAILPKASDKKKLT